MLLVDGDIVVYSVGFACESRWYEVDDEDTGQVLTFQSKKDIAQYNPNLPADLIHMGRQAEPEWLVKESIEEMFAFYMKRFKERAIKVYLTDEDINNNFRRKISEDYKANRKGNVKPIHYSFIRELLMNEWEAEVVTGIEADDALGIAASTEYKGNSVIISKDKDLLQVPGRHYNTYHHKAVTATRVGGLKLTKDKAGKTRLTGHGFKWFCAQMLLGDDIDNIKGISRIGAVKAHKLLKDVRTCQKAWDVIKKVYEEKERDDLMQNAQLLWILRDKGEYFSEEKIRD